MRLTNLNNNNVNFQAIHLKNMKFNNFVNSSLILDVNGYESLGIEKKYISKTDKKAITNYVKNQRKNTLDGTQGEFNSIYFPWSQEGYIISTPLDEQNMYNILKDFNPKTTIDFLL